MSMCSGGLLPVMAATVVGLAAGSAASQEGSSGWKRFAPPVPVETVVFHSPHAINIPTVENIDRNSFEFEISHRFLPAIEQGENELFGLDGPAAIRFALGYALCDALTITLGRSNLWDNVDLNVKGRWLELRNSRLPVVLGFQLGAGWNTDLPGLPSSDARAFQYYGRLLINAALGRKLAVGISPAYLHNSDFFSETTETTTSLGLHAQAYLTGVFSLMAEWEPAIAGFKNYHDPVAFGFELETGGHFFKVYAANSTRLNPSQYLLGSEDPAGTNWWHLGFTVTRLLTL